VDRPGLGIAHRHVFNLFNQSRETNMYSNAGVNFGKPTEICIPRSFRAGLRLFF
jgi:hypothetical protein